MTARVALTAALSLLCLGFAVPRAAGQPMAAGALSSEAREHASAVDLVEESSAPAGRTRSGGPIVTIAVETIESELDEQDSSPEGGWVAALTSGLSVAPPASQRAAHDREQLDARGRITDSAFARGPPA